MGRLATRVATQDEWRQAFHATSGATFVQSPDWYRLTGPVAKGYTAVAHVLELPGGDAVVPLWEKPAGGWLRRRYDVQGNARGVYCAWLRREPLDAAERVQVAQWLDRRTRSLGWRANPFQGVPEAAWASFGPVEPDTTYLVDLTRSEEEIYLAYAGGQRADVNRTRRGGVTCREARGPEDWEAYVDLYEETLGRWGAQATNRYSRAFLTSLAALPSEGCRLWIAELEGAVVAATLHFYHAGHVLGWHLANKLGIKRLSPTKLLIHEVLLDAKRRGFRVYDLNVSGGHEGPERWKQLMGASPVAAPFIRKEPPAMREERLRKAAARRKDAEAQAAARAASGGGA